VRRRLINIGFSKKRGLNETVSNEKGKRKPTEFFLFAEARQPHPVI